MNLGAQHTIHSNHHRLDYMCGLYVGARPLRPGNCCTCGVAASGKVATQSNSQEL